MKLLEERIRKDGIVKPGNVLKVDSFLNHQMDIELFSEMGKEFKRLYEGCPVNKILTIEASGIGIACVVAQYFHVPVVFAKKTQSINLDGIWRCSARETWTAYFWWQRSCRRRIERRCRRAACRLSCWGSRWTG